MSRVEQLAQQDEFSQEDLDYIFTMDVLEYKEYSRRTSRLNFELNRLYEMSKEIE